MADVKDIILFQIERRIFALCKKSLEELEKARDFSLKLEKLMEHAGFEDKEFFMSEENYKAARKALLNECNNSNRELQDLIKQYIVMLKK